MPHTTLYNEKAEIIETIFNGEVDFYEISDALSEIVALSMEKKCYLWLNDYSNSLADITTMDIYRLNIVLLEKAKPLGADFSKVRRAMVPSRNITDFKFAETVASNRGQIIKMCLTLDEARAWLAGTTVAHC